jgi:hypothetical protein
MLLQQSFNSGGLRQTRLSTFEQKKTGARIQHLALHIKIQGQFPYGHVYVKKPVSLVLFSYWRGNFPSAMFLKQIVSEEAFFQLKHSQEFMTAIFI